MTHSSLRRNRAGPFQSGRARPLFSEAAVFVDAGQFVPEEGKTPLRSSIHFVRVVADSYRWTRWGFENAASH